MDIKIDNRIDNINYHYLGVLILGIMRLHYHGDYMRGLSRGILKRVVIAVIIAVIIAVYYLDNRIIICDSFVT
jgi:energy-coupling factor transporter ATP-binding protein EcfA2